MRISRPLAGTAIAAGVLGASLGLGLTMASASTSASPAVTHSAARAQHAASTARSSRAAGAAGLNNKATARSGTHAMKASGHPCKNMSGQGKAGSSSGTSSTAS